ncbi:TorF family putative porin [Rugamonas sp. DEMB1]|uniref:TorF family putative porin n=1 Tax=Rugamonas sp. DEMB1 TaxID=3039386 RepID=UPI00244D6399|nr:TorF family putative porin [Rugamonas sp. DEMB1]WGG51174.1 TorF family putative porin [Rugamonas sp. DEMB1]
MKKLILATAVMAAFAGSYAHAEDIKPDNEVSFNASVVSDYRFRGISQTRVKPAVQGGVDYVNNPTGLYVGAWASNIKWTKDAGGSGQIEVDLYAGKRGQISSEVSYDVGVLSYVYPSNGLATNANTTEVYGQVGYGPAYLKYSHSLTNLFGYADSKNSGYVDLGANIDAGKGFTINLHAGHQKVKGSDVANYTDWKVGATKDFGVVSGALAVVGTNAREEAYSSPVNGKFLGKTALVLSISKTF